VADLTTNVAPPLRVVDLTTGLDIPSQVMSTAGPTSVVRIRADGVPAVGYRVFEVRAGTGTNFPNAATVTLPTFDNGTYGVTLGARGQIPASSITRTPTPLVDGRHRGAERYRQRLRHGDVDAGPVSATPAVGPTGTGAQCACDIWRLDRIDINDGISQNFNTTWAMPRASTGRRTSATRRWG
jgi:alpha-mannosidase